MNTTYEYKILIREGHLDTFRHVNNATYLQIFEEARWELFSQKGHGLEEIEQSGIGLVVMEVHLKFLREIRLREQITILTQLVKFEGKVGTIHQSMVAENKEVKATMELKFGLFDLKSRKLVAPTPEWIAEF
jgi:acyl-CoA thioester hydrolase